MRREMFAPRGIIDGTVTPAARSAPSPSALIQHRVLRRKLVAFRTMRAPLLKGVQARVVATNHQLEISDVVVKFVVVIVMHTLRTLQLAADLLLHHESMLWNRLAGSARIGHHAVRCLQFAVRLALSVLRNRTAFVATILPSITNRSERFSALSALLPVTRSAAVPGAGAKSVRHGGRDKEGCSANFANLFHLGSWGLAHGCE
jgi:hypothetical protein